MIKKGTPAWSFFINLCDDNVPADEALQMTRRRFVKSITSQMMNDLKKYGHERD